MQESIGRSGCGESKGTKKSQNDPCRPVGKLLNHFPSFPLVSHSPLVTLSRRP